MAARKAREPKSESKFELVPPDELEARLPFSPGYRIGRREFTSRILSGTIVFFDNEFTKDCSFWRPTKGLIQFSDAERTLEDYEASALEKDVYAPKVDLFSTSAGEFMRYYRMAWNVRNPALAAPSAPAYPRSKSGTSVGF